ncbi:hypothetical protein [Mycobacterium sp. 1274761.0]|uniref:hypothetical protein n=1 Tax=Mycobacterium sp. 1274761.0 TaxID=1834077 RepID=UPI0007FF270B|nr:hypothetical protein [Mycobacterium sp. 1274761.0]OBK75711.1 hypothetical protein A5651_07145 [Mycobacterium sp. 1274761.0]
MTPRRLVAGVLAASVLLAGCGSNIQGRPVTPSAEPAEPSFPTRRPSTSQPSHPTPTPTTSLPTPQPGGQVLPPDDSGWVFIQTKSGQTRCQLNQQEVDCEAQFAQAPVQNGIPANGVRLTADGTLEWVVGNLGDIPVHTIDYRTYSAVGWTIEATKDGTRFTNQATKHGMFVSIERVQAF